MAAASAITLSRSGMIRHLLSGDIVDGRSIIVVGACRRAGVAIICRVDAVQAAKRVTIPTQKGLRRAGFQEALSVILFNKVKNLAALHRAPRYF